MATSETKQRTTHLVTIEAASVGDEHGSILETLSLWLDGLSFTVEPDTHDGEVFYDLELTDGCGSRVSVDLGRYDEAVEFLDEARAQIESAHQEMNDGDR